jgi:hypothetical protein
MDVNLDYPAIGYLKCGQRRIFRLAPTSITNGDKEISTNLLEL